MELNHAKFVILDSHKDYAIHFHKDSETIGTLDFNGPKMIFIGEAEESAKIFFACVEGYFQRRFEEERNKKPE